MDRSTADEAGKRSYALFFQHNEGLAFQEECRLIEDAFLVSSLIEILTDYHNKGRLLTELEQDSLEDGLRFLKKLSKAERYISEDALNLIPQPEGVRVVSLIIMETGKEEAAENITVTENVLHQTATSKEQLAPIPVVSYEKAIAFLRTLLRGMTKQLAQIPDDHTAF